MSTTNGSTPPAGSSMLIDRRELLRSSQRGTTNNSPSVFSDLLGAAGVVAEGSAGVFDGKSVVQTALSTGGQVLNTSAGSFGGSGGLVGGSLTRSLTTIPAPPVMPGASSLPGAQSPANDYNAQMADFSNQQMQMTMLLQKTQNESLHWQTITNIIKTQHETAMNAVRNLKS
ncbi:MAG: hypothetical protein HQM15_10190 [Deltaproteobacteria bacterium]|nr:hypothetical protein [Deltaproteobacteria bacterium]